MIFLFIVFKFYDANNLRTLDNGEWIAYNICFTDRQKASFVLCSVTYYIWSDNFETSFVETIWWIDYISSCIFTIKSYSLDPRARGHYNNLRMDILSIQVSISPDWMSDALVDGKSALVHVSHFWINVDPKRNMASLGLKELALFVFTFQIYFKPIIRQEIWSMINH